MNSRDCQRLNGVRRLEYFCHLTSNDCSKGIHDILLVSEKTALEVPSLPVHLFVTKPEIQRIRSVKSVIGGKMAYKIGKNVKHRTSVSRRRRRAKDRRRLCPPGRVARQRDDGGISPQKPHPRSCRWRSPGGSKLNLSPVAPAMFNTWAR